MTGFVIGGKKTNTYNIFILVEIFIIAVILVFSTSVIGYFLMKYKDSGDLFAASLIGSFALFVMVVCGIGLMGTQLIWVIGKKKEIGLLMSFGAKKRNIASMVFFNSMKKAIAPGVLGIIAGCLITPVISEMLYLPGNPSVIAVISAFILLIVFTMTATLYPALKAASITPIEALKGTRDINSIKSHKDKKRWTTTAFYIILTLIFATCVCFDYHFKKEMETDIINTSGPPPAIGTKVPYFEVLGQDNVILLNEHFSGSKNLLVLWDVNCPFSIDLLENLSDLKRDLADSGIHVKPILLHDNNQSEDADAQNLLQGKGIDFPVLRDNGKSVKWAFNASLRPAMYLVDEDGIIVYRQMGYNEKVINMLKTLVSQEN